MSASNERHRYEKGMKITAELVEDGFDVSKQLKEILMKQFEDMLDTALIKDGHMLRRDYVVKCNYKQWNMIHDIRWGSRPND